MIFLQKAVFQTCRHLVPAPPHILWISSSSSLLRLLSLCVVSAPRCPSSPLFPLHHHLVPLSALSLATCHRPPQCRKMKNEDKLFLLICSLHSVRLTAERDRGKMEMADLPVHFLILTSKPTSEVWTIIPMHVYQKLLSCAANLSELVLSQVFNA